MIVFQADRGMGRVLADFRGLGGSLIDADFSPIIISGIENRIIIKKVKKCLQILNSQGAWIRALKGRHTSAMWCSPSLRGIVKKKAGRNDLPFDLTNQNPSWDSF